MTARQEETPAVVPVSLMGMNERMVSTLEYFFSHTGERYCKIEDIDKAKMVILDIDSVEGRKIYREEQSLFQGKPVIILSIKHPQREGVTHVQKPVKAPELLAAIDHITKTIPKQTPEQHPPSLPESIPEALHREESTQPAQTTVKKESLSPRSNRETKVDINLAIIQENQQEITNLHPPTKKLAHNKLKLVKTSPTTSSQPEKGQTTVLKDRLVGSAPDLDPDSPEQLKNREYNPDEYFQGYFYKSVINAKQRNQPIRLNIPKGSIVALPNASTVLIDTTESRLQAFSSIPLSEETLTVFFLDNEQLKHFSSKAKPTSVYCLLWKSAIWASRGRFPQGTNLHAPVSFKQWSKIADQVMTFKHTEKIAGLWNQQEVSLLDTAKELNIPQRYVFTFYSACHAIGVASVNSSHPTNEQNRKKPFKLNFMDKVIKRLRSS